MASSSSFSTTNNNNKPTTDADDKWSAQAGLYANQASRITELHGADLVTLLKNDIIKARTILEIGCGTGAFGKAYVQQFPRGVPGQTLILTDLSAGMLAKAREITVADDFATKLVFQQKDGTKLDGIADDSIDLVVSLFGVFLIPDQEATLAAIRRVLNRDGVLANASWMFDTSDYLTSRGFGVTLQDAFQLPNTVIAPSANQPAYIQKWSTVGDIHAMFAGHDNDVCCHQALHTTVWDWENLWNMMVQNPMSALGTASAEDVARAKAALVEFVGGTEQPIMLSTASLLTVVRGFGK